MSTNESLPKHLKIVSWLFIFLGFMALIHTIYLYLNTPNPFPNFLLVLIFVGFGLMKRKAMWRSFALACAGVMLIFTLGDLIIVLSGQKSLSDVPKSIVIAFWVQSILGIAITVYALWALQSKAVKEAFGL